MLKEKRWDSSIAIMVIASLVLISFGVSIWFSDFIEDISTVMSASSKIIIIDAGHGGEDAGAVARDDIYEKDLNLEYAMEIGGLLSEKGYTVVYTRVDDRMLYSPEENIKGHRKISDLKNRLLVCADYPDGILVSIHMNSFGASRYSGLQVYYKDSCEESKALASLIQSSVRKDVQPENNRQIKNGKGLYLLDNCNNASVIVECGFMTNDGELEKLLQKEYKNALSFSIVCGIIEYIEKS